MSAVCGAFVRVYLHASTVVAECAKESGHDGLHESVVGTKWETER